MHVWCWYHWLGIATLCIILRKLKRPPRVAFHHPEHPPRARCLQALLAHKYTKAILPNQRRKKERSQDTQGKAWFSEPCMKVDAPLPLQERQVGVGVGV